MRFWMGKYNSNARNRALNRTPNASNLTSANMSSNDRSTSARSVGTVCSIIQASQQTCQESATTQPVTPGIGIGLTANGTLADSKNSSSDSIHLMIDLNVPYVPQGGDSEVDGAVGFDVNEMINNKQCLCQRKRKACDNTSVNLPGSSSSSNYTRSCLVPGQSNQITPSKVTTGGISMSGTSRTVSDFVSSVRNTGLIPSESLPENQLSIDIHGVSAGDSQLYSPTQSYTISSESSYSSQGGMELINGTWARLQPFIQRHSSSRLQSPSPEHFVETPSFSHIPRANNARSSLQMQSLWHAPTDSSFQSTHFPGASRIALVENSTHLTFGEQHTNFHGGISSASRNQSNAFIQPSITHMMMRDFPESALRYQSNAVIQPSSGPMRYLRTNGVGDRRRAANFLRGRSMTNDIDPPPLPLVIEETVAADNRERLLPAAGSVRELGHRDDPIVIEDDEEDGHVDAQQGATLYVGNLSYEGLLTLQERMGDTGTGLKKKFISELLKQRKYQSMKMNDCSDSCCVCLDTYSDGEELGKIDCGHEFHYHCIRKWLKIKNSCPICKRTALTP